MMKYRIEFGNGQVSNTFSKYREARTELLNLRHDPHALSFRITRYIGQGEWTGLGVAGRLGTLTRRGIDP